MNPNENQKSPTKYTELLEEVLDSVPVGIVVLDPQSRVLAANPKATELLGEIPSGSNASAIFKNIKAEQGPAGEIAATVSKIAIDAASTPSGLQVISLQDITQEALEANNAAQTARLQELGVAAARLAHQLRTPLASALLNTSLAKKRSQDALANASLDKALDQIRLIESRVNSLMRFIKAQNSDISPINPCEAISQAINSCDSLIQTRGVNINFTSAFGQQVNANIDDMTFAFIAIIENAIEANAKNIEISIIESGPIVEISISDDGIGITEEYTEPQPFRTSKQHGTGIGLQIAKNTFACAGGSIRLERTPTGTTVTCTAQIIK